MTEDVLLDVTWAALKSRPSVSEEEIRETITTLSAAVAPDLPDEAVRRVIRRLEERLNVRMGAGSVISDKTVKAWLPDARRSMNQPYWKAYEKYLEEEGFSSGPDGVIRAIDVSTDRILEQMGNPASDTSFDIRGMVVGNVQSGKTANYTALINKAVDAGYRVVIVIAGIHNNLRNQTQVRMDEGFIGRSSDTAKQGRIGVGIHRTDGGMPWSFTSPFSDFNKRSAEMMGGQLEDIRSPSIFVIKKNVSTLRNLTNWLRSYNAESGQDRIKAPMMLIDDEADNATINIAYGKNEVSRINGQIRELVNCFSRSTYVGYTATPFANIFIAPDADHEDFGDELFPRNFIVGLDAPSNYQGSERIFLGEAEEDVLIDIDDNADLLPVKHKIDFNVDELPDSLEDAVRTFVLACAIREFRGQGKKDMSMLVNASRFTGIQEQLKRRIDDLLRHYVEAIRVNARSPYRRAISNPRIALLQESFEEHYASKLEVEFADLMPHLDIGASITVVSINSASRDSLNYTEHENGLKVIAVGGFSLSRGLTLEGLVVSYFLRNSRMYDTLLQMGRWFGYRPGYGDLVRIWMTPEMQGAFEEVAIATVELHQDLRVMEAAGATPQQFGLRVRQSPNSLMITARNKEGDGETLLLSTDLERSFIETAWLRRGDDDVRHNLSVARKFADKLQTEGFKTFEDIDVETGSGLFFSCVPVLLVKEFLEGFRNEDNYSPKTETDAVLQYIRARASQLGGDVDEMNDWDVLFVGLNRADDNNLVLNDFPYDSIITQKRSIGKRSTSDAFVITEKQRVASRGAEKAGLRKSVIKEQQKMYMENRDGVRSYPDYIYREKRDRPLLMVHHLDLRESGDGNNNICEHPVVAWSISFGESAVEGNNAIYRVNRVFLRSMLSDAGEDDDDIADEIREDISSDYNEGRE